MVGMISLAVLTVSVFVFEIDSKNPKFLSSQFACRKLYKNEMRMTIGDITRIEDEVCILVKLTARFPETTRASVINSNSAPFQVRLASRLTRLIFRPLILECNLRDLRSDDKA
jgi:hypothetical protein